MKKIIIILSMMFSMASCKPVVVKTISQWAEYYLDNFKGNNLNHMEVRFKYKGGNIYEFKYTGNYRVTIYTDAFINDEIPESKLNWVVVEL